MIAASRRGRLRFADARGTPTLPVRTRSTTRTGGKLVERVELLRRAGQLEHDGVGADVEEPPADASAVVTSSARRSGAP